MFDIAAGSVVGFEFAHRGRSRVDTMRMMITDLGLDNLLGGGDDGILFSRTTHDQQHPRQAFYTSAGESPIVALGKPRPASRTRRQHRQQRQLGG